MRVFYNVPAYTVIFVLIVIFVFVVILIWLYCSNYISEITISVPAFSYISAVSGEIPESVITIFMSSSDA